MVHGKPGMVALVSSCTELFLGKTSTERQFCISIHMAFWVKAPLPLTSFLYLKAEGDAAFPTHGSMHLFCHLLHQVVRSHHVHQHTKFDEHSLYVGFMEEIHYKLLPTLLKRCLMFITSNASCMPWFQTSTAPIYDEVCTRYIWKKKKKEGKTSCHHWFYLRLPTTPRESIIRTSHTSQLWARHFHNRGRGSIIGPQGFNTNGKQPINYIWTWWNHPICVFLPLKEWNIWIWWGPQIWSSPGLLFLIQVE